MCVGEGDRRGRGEVRVRERKNVEARGGGGGPFGLNGMLKISEEETEGGVVWKA
jgi:hypothetical protein